MASTYLKRTNGTPTNDKIGTISVWVKRSKLGTDQRIHMNFADGSNYAYLRFTEGDLIEVYGVASGSQSTQIRTNRVFRDTNAWYHIVLAIDTTQGTSTDRIKIYVNGVQETSMGTTDYWGQNETCQLLIASGSNYHTVGSAENGSSSFDGSMSHYHKCDGTALAPTVFGETDSTTGEWKIKTNVSFTPGNNGYTILKDGNTITDQSANSNDFSLGAGTLTKTEDCPSSVFNTFNANFQEGGGVLSNGNTTYYNASTSNWYTAASNLAASVGKYYCELKITDATNNMVGVGDMQYLVARGQNSLTHIGALNPGGVGLYNDNGEKYLQGSNTTYAASYGDGDILSIALDMDNDKVYFAKNGDWSTGSGAWGSSTFDAAVGAITLPTTNATYGFASSQRNDAKAEWNFGNGYFGTTAVSSAGTNASGNGIFEYDVPTGYTALSTKGLNL